METPNVHPSVQAELQTLNGSLEDEENKVNHTLTYLKGIALDCLEPTLLDPIDPVWLSDFKLFIEELKTKFGTFNPKGKTKAELKQLHMQENHQATKYFIKFQQLAIQVKWDDAALHHQVYNGLTKCIKNDMVHHSKPKSLVGLHGHVQAINTHYWEH